MEIIWLKSNARKTLQNKKDFVLTYTDAQLGGGGRWGGKVFGRGGLPWPSLKIKRSALILEKNCPHCIHPLVKFAIQNVVLKVSKRKNSKIFPCGAFFLDFLIKCLSTYPNFTIPPLPWKISGCAPEILIGTLSRMSIFVDFFINWVFFIYAPATLREFSYFVL